MTSFLEGGNDFVSIHCVISGGPLKLSDFLKKFRITEHEYKGTKLIWDDLISIKGDFETTTSSLDQVAQDIAERLRKASDKVHSVKFRVKNAENLIEKIVRKKIKNPQRNISLANYSTEITDLIGVRVLHLFKEDWESIHNFIKINWETKETPIAYHRAGDKPEVLKQYQDAGCETEAHPYGYRSIHYLIQTSPTKVAHRVEIQVRTLFEEAWSEIDHLVRYPYDQDHPLLTPYLEIFNRLAGSADEMGSYVRLLQCRLAEEKIQQEKERLLYEKKISSLEKSVKSLQIDEAKQASLEAEIERLRKFPYPSDAIVTHDRSFWVPSTNLSVFTEPDPGIFSVVDRNSLGTLQINSASNYLTIDSGNASSFLAPPDDDGSGKKKRQ